MAIIHIDGKRYEVDGADNLLHACLSLGLDVPYFCWHPALGSVGACRQCAVKMYRDADDQQGRLVMSCMTQAFDNTYISIADAEAKEFRKSVIEWLMVNHPHDCPVCEEGGHCHLQDMTVMAGQNKRRYRFTKRTHRNQELGPFVNHEMNRCIACYRCVRYYNDYADGGDLGVFGAHDNVYFGRVADGQLESEFSGNLTEVCPTGVFTDKTHSARYNRKWDMQFAPSVCQQCAVGCNTSPGERYGELRRIENRYNGAVNHYFLCDRGRFGYGYVNRADRPRQMLARAGTEYEAASAQGELNRLADTVRDAARLVGIGSPRASIEANFALLQLVGADSFSCGMDEAETALLARSLEILRNGAARTPSLREIEDHDAILVLGEDVTQTAPRIALALRQAVRGRAAELAADKKICAWQAEALANIAQHERHPLYIASVDHTRLDDAASVCWRGTPERIAALGFAVAHALDAAAPSCPGDRRRYRGAGAAHRDVPGRGTQTADRDRNRVAFGRDPRCRRQYRPGPEGPRYRTGAVTGIARGQQPRNRDARRALGQHRAAIDRRVERRRGTRERSVPSRGARAGRCGAGASALRAGHRSSAQRHRRTGARGAPGGEFRGRRWHAGEQRRPRAALLPGLRPRLLQPRDPDPRELALARRACGSQPTADRWRGTHSTRSRPPARRRIPTWRASSRPRRVPASAWRANASRASRTAIRGAPRCVPMCRCTRCGRRRMSTARWRSRWRVMAVPRSPAH